MTTTDDNHDGNAPTIGDLEDTGMTIGELEDTGATIADLPDLAKQGDTTSHD